MYKLVFPTPSGLVDVIGCGGFPTKKQAKTHLADRIADGHAFPNEQVASELKTYPAFNRRGESVRVTIPE